MVLTCYDFNHMKCMHALHGDAHPLAGRGPSFPCHTLPLWPPGWRWLQTKCLVVWRDCHEILCLTQVGAAQMLRQHKWGQSWLHCDVHLRKQSSCVLTLTPLHSVPLAKWCGEEVEKTAQRQGGIYLEHAKKKEKCKGFVAVWRKQNVFIFVIR